MIFVTVGTSSHKFNRLLRMIDELCEEGIIEKSNVFAQIGACDYRPKNYQYTKSIMYEEHQKYIKDSEYIITHAGTGSIISALKLGKKVIAIPRLSKYKEHIDDHQIELINAFMKKGYILSANNKAELKKSICEIDKFTPNKFISNSYKINYIIENFIQNIR